MADTCEKYREQIGRGLFGELGASECQELERHLAECCNCEVRRQELEQTLRTLRSLEDVEVPGHYFVTEEDSAVLSRWLPSRRSWAWKAARAALLTAFLISAGLLVSGLQVRLDSRSLTLAYGQLPPETSMDEDVLRRELIALFEESLEKREVVWMEQVRSEIGEARDLVSEEQDKRVTAVLEGVNSRWETRLQEENSTLSSEFKAGLASLYRTLDLRHQNDIDHLSSRIDIVNVRDEIQGSQTEALVSTLVQFADFQLREPQAR